MYYKKPVQAHWVCDMALFLLFPHSQNQLMVSRPVTASNLLLTPSHLILGMVLNDAIS